MKTGILTLLSFFFLQFAQGQCEKEISTNPGAPVNNEFLTLANEWHGNSTAYTVNSYLNHWSWYPPSNTQFNLNLSQGWENNLLQSLSMPMDNPFFATGTPTFIHQQANTYQYRDFRWEDGWELLWMNLGIHPNLDQALSPSPGTYYGENNILSNPLPTNVPYFVLYNRYRGVLRIFANVWTNNLLPNAQEILIGLRFDEFAVLDAGLSGILRHSLNYDTPLDQPTSGDAHFSPRMQATNTSSFLVADFQMAFDPCICLKETDPSGSDLGKLQFEFQTFQTMDIDMVSRGISIDDAITAASFTDDFYNLSEINSEEYKPGHRIYTKMDGLYDDYLEKLEKYKDVMAAQNDDYDFLKAFLSKVAPSLTNDFVASWSIDDVVVKLKEDPDMAALSDSEVESILEEQRKKHELSFNKKGDFVTKSLQSLTKGLLAIGFDYLNLELFPKKSTPVKPTTPVANFTETLFKGTITNTNVATSSQLYQPGGVIFVEKNSPVGWGHGIVDLDHRNMPAYNTVLGQAALMRTPVSDFYFETKYPNVERNGTGDDEIMDDGEFQWISYGVVQAMSTPLEVKFKFSEELEFALNNSLDFDLDKTKSYISLEVEFKNDMKSNDIWPWWDVISHEIIDRTLNIGNNLNITNYIQKDDGRILQTNSRWVSLSELNQYVFSIDLVEEIEIHGSTYNLDYVPFDPQEAKYEISKIKVKVLHDFYFDQIGYLGEQINTTQVHTYLMFDKAQNINFMSTLPSEWSDDLAPGVVDEYLTGTIEVGPVMISSLVSDPLVKEVINGNTIINAQDVIINELVTVVPVPQNDLLTIQALEQIHLVPGAHLNTSNPSKVHLKIKNDFYNLPIFEYSDNGQVYNFCNNSSMYQANVSSKSMSLHDRQNNGPNYPNVKNKNNSEKNFVSIHPNPANSQIRISSSSTPISEIQIIDLAGRILIHEKPGNSNVNRVLVNIHSLQSGVYIVQTQCGNERSSQKLVVGK